MLDGGLMDTFSYFCQVIGFSVIVILLFMVFIALFSWFFEQILRHLNNKISERLMQLIGLVKMQSLYANRDYLTFVWRKKDICFDNEDDT